MTADLQIPPEISHVTKKLQEKGFLAYIVGGCVRDIFINQRPKDWDITTNATPEDIEGLFPKTFYENKFGTVTVVNEETDDLTLKNVEVTPFRRETTYSDHRHPDAVFFSKTLAEDLSRRDFTVNALAYDPKTGELVDLYGGIKDIKDKVIKTVGKPEERFEEDALRIMRAIRLSTQLGFKIEDQTKKAIANKADTLNKIAKERIREEFNKLLMSDTPMVGLQMLHVTHLLGFISKELTDSIGVTQNGQHKYDVWEHLIRSLQHAADKNMSLELRLSALFHDIGKPPTRRWSKAKNNWTFYGHEVVGAKITKKILTDLKYSKKTIEIVTTLVRYHMFFVDIDKITLSAVRRVVAGVGPELIWDLIKLRTCDRIGMGRPKEEPYRLRKYEAMIEEAMRAPTSVTMLKINGGDLIKDLDLKPGPKIGLILHALLEEVLEDPLKNELEYLKEKGRELATLEDADLKKLADQGKSKKDLVENEELKKIRRKHGVK